MPIIIGRLNQFVRLFNDRCIHFTYLSFPGSGHGGGMVISAQAPGDN